MDKLVIRGGQPLRGTLPVSGSKNTALPLMSAALLAGGTTTLHNVPALRDIHTFARVLRVTGAEADFNPNTHTVVVDASDVPYPEVPYELMKRMRASFYMLGAMLGRCGEARVSMPGGCAWGPRPIDLHLEGLKALGASIDLDQGYVVARAPQGGLPGGIFHMEPSSVGATINIMLAAATAKGSSRILNAATEPDVVVFGRMLQQMGAQLSGLGTRVIEIQGVDSLAPVEFENCPDRIELGTFMIAAAIAGEPGDPIRITHADPTQLGRAFIDAFEQTGAFMELGEDTVTVAAPEELKPVSIETGVYPEFPTDLQAQWTVLLTQAEGNARVKDSIYYDRFKHIPELRRMNVNGIVIGNEVVIEGKMPIKGATVMSTDLRASVSLVLAGMVAEGETHVLRVYHLDRGYENLEGKLSNAGIDIERVQYDEFADPVVETHRAA